MPTSTEMAAVDIAGYLGKRSVRRLKWGIGQRTLAASNLDSVTHSYHFHRGATIGSALGRSSTPSEV